MFFFMPITYHHNNLNNYACADKEHYASHESIDQSTNEISIDIELSQNQQMNINFCHHC